MYRKILVPLDGSELAESVLPHVEGIAKGCGVKEVDLVTVIPKLTVSYTFKNQGYVEKLDAAVIGKERMEVDRYLDKVTKGLIAKGVKVVSCVHVGKPAEEIVIHAENSGCDLIIMASHGRSGPSRLAFGSVADKVFRSSCIPVMMVRPPSCMPRE